MASTKMKIKKDKSGGHVEKDLVKHQMQTGNRKEKKAGKKETAQIGQTIVIKHNGEVVAQAHLGPAVSKNPLTQILLTCSKSGDTVAVHFTDIKGHSGGTETAVK
mgnify:CR=1 FL=1